MHLKLLALSSDSRREEAQVKHVRRRGDCESQTLVPSSDPRGGDNQRTRRAQLRRAEWQMGVQSTVFGNVLPSPGRIVCTSTPIATGFLLGSCLGFVRRVRRDSMAVRKRGGVSAVHIRTICAVQCTTGPVTARPPGRSCSCAPRGKGVARARKAAEGYSTRRCTLVVVHSRPG